jgi:AbrB family looped-hinge helix DNA binding protein
MDHLIRIGAKGRAVIPAALRAELHVAEGDELVARAEEGRIVLETRQAIKNRLRAQAAAANRDGGVVGRLLADREADARLDEQRSKPRRRASAPA